MFGELFADRLGGCDFWGHLQEDMFVGDLRAFLDERTLEAHDTISPLLAPWFHAGPFMVYRNSPAIRSLFRRSSQWKAVVADPEYMAFDEWWGKRLYDHMPAVIDRERKAGRVRAYVASPQNDSKIWLTDDYIYGAEQDFTFSKDSARWYDETLLFTWRRAGRTGSLWAGTGSRSTTKLWDGTQGQRAIFHLMASKHMQTFAKLEVTDHLLRLAAHLHEMKISRHGLWLKVNEEGRTHTWYSGQFPGVHLLVRSADLLRAAERLVRLGKPHYKNHLAAEVDQSLPCVTSARLDESRVPQSCAECLAVQQAVARSPRVSSVIQGCTARSRRPLNRSRPPLDWACEPRQAAASPRYARRASTPPSVNVTSVATQCMLVMHLAGEWRRRCDKGLLPLIKQYLSFDEPAARGDVKLQSTSLLPSWAMAHGVQVCSGQGTLLSKDFKGSSSGARGTGRSRRTWSSTSALGDTVLGGTITRGEKRSNEEKQRGSEPRRVGEDALPEIFDQNVDRGQKSRSRLGARMKVGRAKDRRDEKVSKLRRRSREWRPSRIKTSRGVGAAKEMETSKVSKDLKLARKTAARKKEEFTVPEVALDHRSI